jgi:hypothetical protein
MVPLTRYARDPILGPGTRIEWRHGMPKANMNPRSGLPLATLALLLTLIALELVPQALGLSVSVEGQVSPLLNLVPYPRYIVLEIPIPLAPVVLDNTPTPSPTPIPTSTTAQTASNAPTRTHTPSPAPPSSTVELKVYDVHGAEQSYAWAVEKYGVHVEQMAGWGYHCVELRERSGPSSVDVWVRQASGAPAGGVRVEFHWPGDMKVQYTEASGKAGFGYGRGSWINEPAAGGAHWLVVQDMDSCDAVSRLGMLGGTNHDHLDVSYSYGYR